MTTELITLAGNRVPGPGIYRMPASAYHADPAPEPSLSSSIAVDLIHKTPRHAQVKHPRLYVPDTTDGVEDEAVFKPTRPMEIGSAAHKLLLGEGSQIVEIEAPDYKGKLAQADRALAYGQDKLPILKSDLVKARKMVRAALEQLSANGVGEEFAQAIAEPVLVWPDASGVWGRAMMDKLFIGENHAIIFDLKTTTADLTQDDVGRKVVDMGYETRAAFYERGLYSLFPHLAGKTQFVHLWLEMDLPYALLPADLDGAALTIGRKQAAAAFGLWAECMESGEWPLFPPGVARVDYPVWAERNWLERETNDDHIARIISRDPFLNASPFHLAAPGAKLVGAI